MIGKISMMIICHCIYSAIRYRKFLQGNAQQFQYLPIDIIIQSIVGIILASIAITQLAFKIKKIHNFQQIDTYDKAMERKNFANYDSNRGQILQDIVLKRLHIVQFEVPS